MRKLIQIASLAALAGVALVGGALWWAAEATQDVPDFYRSASTRAPEELAAASEELQARVESLQNQVRQEGHWNAEFSDEQINAWLVNELPRQFPRALPSGVREPRVVIDADRIRAAARYESKRLNAVISFELHVRLTDEPNVLAIEIDHLRAGSLPLPIGQFREAISRAALRDGVVVKWSGGEGDPVALVTVPSDHEKYALKPVIIESIELADGALGLAGRTGPRARQAFTPDGQIFRTASAVRRVSHQR